VRIGRIHGLQDWAHRPVNLLRTRSYARHFARVYGRFGAARSDFNMACKSSVGSGRGGACTGVGRAIGGGAAGGWLGVLAGEDSNETWVTPKFVRRKSLGAGASEGAMGAAGDGGAIGAAGEGGVKSWAATARCPGGTAV
jgi:hypothetical protein